MHKIKRVNMESTSSYCNSVNQIIENATSEVGSWNDELDIYEKDGIISKSKCKAMQELCERKLSVANDAFNKLAEIFLYKELEQVKSLEKSSIIERTCKNGDLLGKHLWALESYYGSSETDIDIFNAAKIAEKFVRDTECLVNKFQKAETPEVSNELCKKKGSYCDQVEQIIKESKKNDFYYLSDYYIHRRKWNIGLERAQILNKILNEFTDIFIDLPYNCKMQQSSINELKEISELKNLEEIQITEFLGKKRCIVIKFIGSASYLTATQVSNPLNNKNSSLDFEDIRKAAKQALKFISQ
jgi:hypothetical protein